MKKRIIGSLLLLCMFIAMLPTTVLAATEGYYTYTVSGGKATITDVSYNLSGAVTIPATLGGYPVTSIGYQAFYVNDNITSVIIPDGVIDIGTRAFCWCKKLVSVTIPDSVTSIGNEAFRGCDMLTSVDIPDSVTNISYYAFENCKGLTSIKLPDGLTVLNSGVFNGCPSLSSVVIPDSVTTIKNIAFNSCTSLNGIVIPDSVTSIEYNAFRGCTNLSDIYYTGSEQLFSKISIDTTGNDVLTTATIHYNYFDGSLEVEEEVNQYTQEHLVFINSNKYNNLTSNASFYNSIWKYEEETSNFTRYAAWDVIGRVGKGLSLDLYGAFKTDNPYDIILTDLFRSYVNKEKSKGAEIFETKAKKILGAPGVFNSLLSVLKTSDAWDASLEKDWNRFTGKVQGDWVEGVFLKESTFDLEDYSPELYSVLHEIFSKTDKSKFESIFTDVQDIGTIFEYVTSANDIVYSFYAAYEKYLLAQALYETNEYVLTSLQVLATQMPEENSELLLEALAPYWEAYDCDSALDSVFDIMLIGGYLGSMGNVAYSLLGKDLLKDFCYVAIKKVTGLNLGALPATYNLTYMCLDYLSGLGDLTETHRLMNAAALLEKEYIELAKIQADTLSTEKTYIAAANFDATWGFLQLLESYCYKTMSEYLSAFKQEYKFNYNVKTSVVQNCFYTVARRTELTEQLASCDAAIQAVVYLESEWINGDCHKGIYSSSNLMTVKCPSEVYVYDSENELVLSITDNGVTHCVAHITAFVDADDKIFVLPTDQEYSIRIVATDDSTMDYAVKSFDDVALLRTITYDDIEITNDSNYTAVVLPELYIPKEEYNVITDAGEQIEADFDSMEIGTLDFKGASLVLQNSLSINYKVDKALFEDGYTNPYVVFELNGVQTKVSEYSVVNDRYVFEFANIIPHQMNDTIYATLYATYNGVVYASETREYSVADYCYNMLSKCSGDEYAEFRTLLVDLLNYGAESQKFMDYRTDALVNAHLTEHQRVWGTAENRTLTTVQDTEYAAIENPSVLWKGAGLNLQKSVAMRFKIACDGVEGVTVRVTNDIGEETIITSDQFESTQGGYYVFFDGLNAGQMSDVVYLTVYEGDTAVSHTIRYSIESYAYAKQNGTDAKLSELVKAMIKYGDSAKAYVD